MTVLEREVKKAVYDRPRSAHQKGGGGKNNDITRRGAMLGVKGMLQGLRKGRVILQHLPMASKLRDHEEKEHHLPIKVGRKD